MNGQCLKEKISKSISLKGEHHAGGMNQSMYNVSIETVLGGFKVFFAPRPGEDSHVGYLFQHL